MLFSVDANWDNFCKPNANSVGTTYLSNIFNKSSTLFASWIFDKSNGADVERTVSTEWED